LEILSLNVSIVIPAYNAAAEIVRCLSSIAGQEAHGIGLEVVIVNDGSTDDTAAVVAHYIAQNKLQNYRLINLQPNQGRFQARLAGIKAAANDTIMFVDSKIELARNAMQTIERINYLPLIGTQQRIVFNHIFDHFFFLVRRRNYFKEFPKVPGKFIYITEDNFDRCPKGIADFVCPKQILLGHLPENVGKDASDDTYWIKNISLKHKIMIHNDYEVIYYPRSDAREIISHVYERGPKFIDYYYRPSSVYFWIINAGLLAAFLLLYLIVGAKAYMAAAACGLAVNIATAAFLSRNPKDFVVSLIVFPVIGTAFLLGLLRGIVGRLVPLRQ
jgi:glycosyltransferase involved in cell wall biosynthesis